MADGNVVRRRREAPERFNYRQALEQIADFVDNELGNGGPPPPPPRGAPRPPPDNREWRIQRAKTIRTLDELREKLDTICIGANYGKVVGNGAEILGGGSAMIGALMSLAGAPSGDIVKNAGNLLQHAGAFLDGTCNVVESLVYAKYLNNIEQVLKKDQELSEPFMEWLNFTNRLDANVQEIFGVSLASEKFNTVCKVFYEFSKISNSVSGFDTTMRLMRQGKYSVHIGKDVQIEKLVKFFNEVLSFPQLGDRIRVTLSVLSVTVGAIQVYRDGARLKNCIMGISSSSVVQILQGGLNPEIPTTREVTSFCIFQTISLACSVLSLINARSIIRNGTSKYSDAIKELTRALNRELRAMENL